MREVATYPGLGTLYSGSVPCADCGGAAIATWWGDEPSRPPAWCMACLDQKHAAGVAAKAARRAVRLTQFPDLAPRVGAALARAGFTSRAAVAQASDAELLTHKMIGPWVLAAVRVVFPPPNPAQAQRLCPHCHGTGYVDG